MSQYQKDYSKGIESDFIQCQDLLTFKEGLAAIKQNDLWGYINTKGEIVIPCQYSSVSSFSEGLATVSNIDGLDGAIDAYGKQVIPFRYDTMFDCKNGLIAVEQDASNKCGYIDKTGQLVIPYQYYFAYDFIEEVTAVSLESEDGIELSGFINKKNEVVIPFKYIDAEGFSNGFAWVETDDYYAMINKQGEEVFKLTSQGDSFLYFYEDIVFWEEEDGWFLQNLTTNIKTKLPDLKSLSFRNDGVIVVENRKKKFGAIDKNGRIIIPFQFEELNRPYEGLIAYKLNGKYGYIDYKGNIVIPPQYDEAYPFSSEVAIVKKGKLEHVIDKKGNILFSLKKEKGTLWNPQTKKSITIFTIIAVIISLLIIYFS